MEIIVGALVMGFVFIIATGTGDSKKKECREKLHKQMRREDEAIVSAWKRERPKERKITIDRKVKIPGKGTIRHKKSYRNR